MFLAWFKGRSAISAWRTLELGIDTIDPAYYPVAQGDGYPRASRSDVDLPRGTARDPLQSLWSVLDGNAAPNPVDESEKPREPEAHALSYPTIRRSSTRCQCRAGSQRRSSRRPEQDEGSARADRVYRTSLIKRLRPEDVNLRAGTMIVSARGKGKGVERRSVVLTAEGLEALRHFADLDCWRSFSNSSVWKSWRRACKAAGLTTTPRPCHLRHSFGTEMYVATGDTKAVSGTDDARTRKRGRAPLYNGRRGTAIEAGCRGVRRVLGQGSRQETAGSLGWLSTHATQKGLIFCTRP